MVFRILIVMGFIFSFHQSYAWKLEKAQDKMTDESFVFISQMSKAPVWSRKHAMLQIAINCKTKEWKLMLHHPWLVESLPVKIRVDKSEPKDFYAARSADKKSLFIGDASSQNKKPKNIVDLMISGQSVLMQYYEVAGKVAQAEFEVSGLKATMQSKKVIACEKP